MAEHLVARRDELAPGEHKVVAAGAIRVGLYRIGDDYYALPNICPHQRGPLCEGRTGGAIIATAATGWRPDWFHDGEVIACPWHGLEFRVTTGQCLAYPKLRLRRYPVIVDADGVKVVV